MAAGVVSGILARLGFADVLLWLLSFAVVYGVLSQADIPKSKQVRAIIAIVLAFFVLIAVPTTLISALSQLSSALLVVVLGIFILIVLLEVGGVKHVAEIAVGYDEKTGKPNKFAPVEERLWSQHPYIIAISLIMIVALIFIGAGGLKLIGLNVPGIDIMGSAFFILIILAVLWMIQEGKGKK
jgi:hypothetical protein